MCELSFTAGFTRAARTGGARRTLSAHSSPVLSQARFAMDTDEGMVKVLNAWVEDNLLRSDFVQSEEDLDLHLANDLEICLADGRKGETWSNIQTVVASTKSAIKDLESAASAFVPSLDAPSTVRKCMERALDGMDAWRTCSSDALYKSAAAFIADLVLGVAEEACLSESEASESSDEDEGDEGDEPDSESEDSESDSGEVEDRVVEEELKTCKTESRKRKGE